MLLWETTFLFFLFLTFWSFMFSSYTVFSLILHSEFLVLVTFCLFLSVGIYYSINTLFLLAYIFLILGGLELALSILLFLL